MRSLSGLYRFFVGGCHRIQKPLENTFLVDYNIRCNKAKTMSSPLNYIIIVSLTLSTFCAKFIRLENVADILPVF